MGFPCSYLCGLHLSVQVFIVSPPECYMFSSNYTGETAAAGYVSGQCLRPSELPGVWGGLVCLPACSTRQGQNLHVKQAMPAV